jgi:uncharacterized membrane protein
MLGRTQKLLRSIDVQRIEGAIHAAEQQTSGQIRVSIAPLTWGKVQRLAEKTFRRLGMSATRERNGVLLFIMPSRRRFVVLGDEGIHGKVGQEFWHLVASVIGERFRTGDFTGGIVRGVQSIGEQLATHFPARGEDQVNELPDDVDFGPRRAKR